jgi:putative YhbY family RNA-binding protein
MTGDLLTPKMKRRIKQELGASRPTVWIGKNGASEEVLSEIDHQLERMEMVKVRVLKAALAEVKAKEIAERISQKTESALVDARGHTFLLFRKRKQ